MTSILVSIYIIFCYITDSIDMNISKLQEIVKERGTWWATVHGVTKSQTWLSDWKTAGEGDDREWDGWMASPTWWIWVWVNSGSWWWTERPGVLRFMGLQSWTRLSDWTELIAIKCPVTNRGWMDSKKTICHNKWSLVYHKYRRK